MKLNRLIFAFSILALYGACDVSHPLNSEEKIISDVFPDLIEFYRMGETNFIPPPPPPKPDSSNEFTLSDSIEYELFIANFNRMRDSVSQIHPNLLIAVGDSLRGIPYRKSGFGSFRNADAFESILDFNKDRPVEVRAIKLEDIHLPNGYEFELQSIIGEDYSWRTKNYSRLFGGYVSFSKIYFNEDSDKALLFVEQAPFRDAGTGYMMLLSLVGSKWQVDEKLMYWIS